MVDVDGSFCPEELQAHHEEFHAIMRGQTAGRPRISNGLRRMEGQSEMARGGSFDGLTEHEQGRCPIVEVLDAELLHQIPWFGRGFSYVRVGSSTSRIVGTKRSRKELAEYLEPQASEPVFLTNYGPARLWKYRGFVYADHNRLTGPELKAALASQGRCAPVFDCPPPNRASFHVRQSRPASWVPRSAASGYQPIQSASPDAAWSDSGHAIPPVHLPAVAAVIGTVVDEVATRLRVLAGL